MIDLDAEGDEAWTQAAARMLSPAGEDRLAIRGGRLLAARLEAAPPEPRNDEDPSFAADPNAAYLLTGGLGALGLRTAEWLVSRGAKSLAILSRRAPDERQTRALDALRDRAEILNLTGDVAVAADLASALAETARRLPPLKGVFHLAGKVGDALLGQQDRDRLDAVWQPKALGALLLDRMTRDLPLDWFVLFSSLASLAGNRGQANYAAANAFLDGLAWRRRAEGLPALSVNWGPWRDGMAERPDARAWLQRQGFEPMPAPAAFATLERLLRQDAVQAAVAACDWGRYRRAAPAAARGSLLADLAPQRTEQDRDIAAGAFREKLAETDPAERRERLLAFLNQQANRVFGAGAEVHPKTPLMDQGFDSLMAVELQQSLNRELDVEISIGAMFNHPTLEQLTDGLLARWLTFEDAAPNGEAEPEPETTAEDFAYLEELDAASLAALIQQDLAAQTDTAEPGGAS